MFINWSCQFHSGQISVYSKMAAFSTDVALPELQIPSKLLVVHAISEATGRKLQIKILDSAVELPVVTKHPWLSEHNVARPKSPDMTMLQSCRTWSLTKSRRAASRWLR